MGPNNWQKNKRYPSFHFWESNRNTKLNNCNIFAVDLLQTLADSVITTSVSVSCYNPCLMDFCWLVFSDYMCMSVCL